MPSLVPPAALRGTMNCTHFRLDSVTPGHAKIPVDDEAMLNAI